MGATTRPGYARYGLALLLPLLALLLTSIIARPDRGPYLQVFTVAVVIASAYGGTRPGLVALAESAFLNVLAAAPHWSLRIATWDDTTRIAVFSFASGGIAILIGSLGEVQYRLDRERSQLSITLRSIADAVIATDVQGRITLMNPAAERATGWTFSAAAGLSSESVFNIVHEGSRKPVQSPVRRVLDGEDVAGLENHTALQRPDGTEIPIEDSAAPIRDERGKTIGAVLVFRDVTESRVHQNALIRSEKLEAARKLGATIAHETNNPLEALANLLFLISRDHAVSESTRKHVELALAELSRAVEASRRTLSFIRVDQAVTRLNLKRLVDSVLQSYQATAGNRHIDLQNEIPPDIEITALRNDLQQLVSNLISNAVDAMMSAGGVLRVSAEVISTPGLRRVRINFSDTGHGIEPADLGRIFEPFFTTKKDKGTGLGLWMAKRVAEDHGGELQVESNQNGTTFVVLLPVDRVHGLVSADAPDAQSQPTVAEMISPDSA